MGICSFGRTTGSWLIRWDVIVPRGTSVCAKTRTRSAEATLLSIFDSGPLLC